MDLIESLSTYSVDDLAARHYNKLHKTFVAVSNAVEAKTKGYVK